MSIKAGNQLPIWLSSSMTYQLKVNLWNHSHLLTVCFVDVSLWNLYGENTVKINKRYLYLLHLLWHSCSFFLAVLSCFVCVCLFNHRFCLLYVYSGISRTIMSLFLWVLFVCLLCLGNHFFVRIYADVDIFSLSGFTPVHFVCFSAKFIDALKLLSLLRMLHFDFQLVYMQLLVHLCRHVECEIICQSNSLWQSYSQLF